MLFCVNCGNQMRPTETFCASCGKPVRDMPMMPVKSRIAGHVRLVGILWLALSAFRLIPAFVLMLMIDMGPLREPDVPMFVRELLGVVSAVFACYAIAGFIAGYGLLIRKSWARMLAIVLGGLSLIDVPFGTALGVYTLWVLLPAASEEEYRRAAMAA